MRKLASNWCNYCVSVSPATAGVNQLCSSINKLVIDRKLNINLSITDIERYKLYSEKAAWFGPFESVFRARKTDTYEVIPLYRSDMQSILRIIFVFAILHYTLFLFAD